MEHMELILLRFFSKIIMGEQNARRLKRCVSYDRYDFDQLLFQPMQMCKRSTLFHSHSHVQAESI